jgi:hypothetical protein
MVDQQFQGMNKRLASYFQAILKCVECKTSFISKIETYIYSPIPILI